MRIGNGAVEEEGLQERERERVRKGFVSSSDVDLYVLVHSRTKRFLTGFLGRTLRHHLGEDHVRKSLRDRFGASSTGSGRKAWRDSTSQSRIAGGSERNDQWTRRRRGTRARRA